MILKACADSEHLQMLWPCIFQRKKSFPSSHTQVTEHMSEKIAETLSVILTPNNSKFFNTVFFNPE